MAVGDFENARGHQAHARTREAIIAEFRAKRNPGGREEEAKSRRHIGGKELNGYPVETFNDPEVLALKNGYPTP